jgi:hypothetical protein
MKTKGLVLIFGLLLIGSNVFAADGDLIVNGNVGIGTPSPSTVLQVVKNAAGNSIVQITNTTVGAAAQALFRTISDEGSVSFGASNSGHSSPKALVWSNLPNRDLVFAVNSGEKMRIASGGNVGIGNTNPTHLLTMEAGTGGGFYETEGHTWQSGSSGRWKSSVMPITGALDTVLKLNGVSFKWKKRTDIFETVKEGEEETQKYVSSYWSDDPNGKDDIGLIGEDVVKVLPQVVAVDQKDSNFAAGVAYAKIVALLIEAVKEQQKAIEDLRAELDQLKTR